MFNRYVKIISSIVFVAFTQYGCANKVAIPDISDNNKISLIEDENKKQNLENMLNNQNTTEIKEKEFSKDVVKKELTIIQDAKKEGKRFIHKSDKYDILALDKFFNTHFKYKTDKENYGKADYWASLIEMVDKGQTGDCEDFTFGKISLAKYFNIKDSEILIGYTKEGEHLFPVFHDRKLNDYFVSESSGRLRELDDVVAKYPDVKFFSLEDIFKTDEPIFADWRKDGALNKVAAQVIPEEDKKSKIKPKRKLSFRKLH